MNDLEILERFQHNERQQSELIGTMIDVYSAFIQIQHLLVVPDSKDAKDKLEVAMREISTHLETLIQNMARNVRK